MRLYFKIPIVQLKNKNNHNDKRIKCEILKINFTRKIGNV